VTRHNERVLSPHPTDLAPLVDRVDLHALTEDLLARFRDAIGGYARLPDELLRGQIGAILLHNLELCFTWVGTGREPTEEDLEPLRRSAKDRAGEGMPLEDLLQAYRLGGKAGWHALVAAADGPERDALPYAAELVMDYIDRVSATVAQAYLEERQHLVSEEERSVRRLFDTLVADEEPGPALRALADRLGFPVAPAYRALGIGLPRTAARAHAQHASALRAHGVLALTEGDRIVALVPVGAPIPAGLPSQALVVASGDVARARLAAALDDVRSAIDLGRRLGRTGEVALDELVVDLLLARAPDLAATLVRRVLGPLAGRPGALDTLTAFLAVHQDRRAAAAALHVHPNTVDYRIQRVQEAIGLDLTAPDDVALVVLALRARAVWPDAAPER
jgi:hypothetical protein